MTPIELATSNGTRMSDLGADAALAVRGMTVSYGQKPAVFSVDMTVPVGSMTAIIGPNGAGKSTLLRPHLVSSNHSRGLRLCSANPLKWRERALRMCRNARAWIGISRRAFWMWC